MAPTKKKNGTKAVELMSSKERKFKLFLLHHETKLTGTALMRRFNHKYSPNKVSYYMVHTNITSAKYAQWLKGEGSTRKTGSGRRKSITEDMKPQVRKWIEDDPITKS